MDELEKNIPDDFWRKAFDEAAETPPARVWNAIEHKLDTSSEARIIPLWGSGLASSKPVIWGTGIAAALALLFVGWWAIHTQQSPQATLSAQVSGNGQSGRKATTQPVQDSGMLAPVSPKQSEGMAAVENSPGNVASSAAEASVKLTRRSIAGVGIAQVDKDYFAQSLTKADNVLTRTNMRSVTLPNGSDPVSASSFTPTSLRRAGAPMLASAIYSTNEVIAYEPNSAMLLKELKGKSLRLRSPRPIQRIVWFQPAELRMEPELIKAKHKAQEKWASVSVMPASFNPMVSVRSAQTAYANSIVAGSPANQSTVNSQANFSVAYQASAGIQVNDRWSVESGVGYLAGHSTVDSPSQSMAFNYASVANSAKTTVVNNTYVDALRSSTATNVANLPATGAYDNIASNYLTQTSYSNQSRQTLTNDYQYMQVPVQVGYQLRPRKRLSLAVLGGLVTNIFVRNTVGTDLVITSKDGVYRPVTLAASMGARVRYRPSGHWSASLAGLYQPSLESGNRSDAQVQSHPTATGMSFGLDYHF